LGGWNPVRGAAGTSPQDIQTPVLKWQRGGCYNSWCETGWTSSPAVADLDNDGTMEVIGGAYTVFILNGEDGSVQHSINPDGDRVWPGVVVTDLDNNGDLEIVTAHNYGYLHVMDHHGNIVWSKRPASNELRGLAVYDLDGDKTMEIVVSAGVGSRTNTWVYEHNGTLRPGWPQLNNDSGYAWGVFNDNAAIGDIDADGIGEIVVPSDVHYICAYEPNGVQIPADYATYGDKAWGKVGVWENLAVELRGWGYCNGVRSESYRPNFAHSPAAIADVNGDGIVEVISTGNVYQCTSGYPSRYIGVFLFNADRTRFNTGGYDWRSIPQDTGSPLSEDWNVIESAQPNPALADLDGDGNLEILYASYDGRLHVFWLDKQERYNWPYSVYTGGAYRFASEPTVADLDNDGTAEVIFASWVQKHTNLTGKLHILDYRGNVLREVNLPLAFNGDWNGALAAPTLANIDNDDDLEVVLNTAHSGFVAYDLPGTADARILWSTGRGNYQRTGSFLEGTLRPSWASVQPTTPDPGDTLFYSIHLENPGPTLETVQVTATLPAGVSYQGDLSAPSGSYSEAGGVITWTGAVAGGEPLLITYSATVDAGISQPTALIQPVVMDDGLGNLWQHRAVAIVNGFKSFMPIVFQQ